MSSQIAMQKAYLTGAGLETKGGFKADSWGKAS